jgi:hypothetical protein
MEMEVSIKDAADELIDTKIFKAVAERNSDRFAKKLAFWLVRYILVVSSMNEGLEINLEIILSRLHGEDNFKKILELTEKMFRKLYEQSNNRCYTP